MPRELFARGDAWRRGCPPRTGPLVGVNEVAGVILYLEQGAAIEIEHPHDAAQGIFDGPIDLVRCEGHAGQRDRAIRAELHGPLAGRGHDRRNGRPEPLPDLGEERFDPSLDQLRTIRDALDDLDVDL